MSDVVKGCLVEVVDSDGIYHEVGDIEPVWDIKRDGTIVLPDACGAPVLYNPEQVKFHSDAIVKVRANCGLKLMTSTSDVDIQFTRTTTVESILNEAINAVVQNVGVEQAKKVIDAKLGAYQKDYKGMGK